MQPNLRDIRQLYRISSADPDFQLNDNKVQWEKCYHIDSGREYTLQTFRKYSKSARYGPDIIKVLLELDHPNIMKIYDFFESDDSIQTVLQKCEGANLFRELQRLPGYILNEKLASNLISQILSSVKHLHRKHLLLREISVDNILVYPNSSGYDLKITYFGVGLGISTPTKSDLEGMLGVEHDLFSIGLIALNLVTGVRFFLESENDEELLIQVQNREEFQSLSSDCKSFILECLSKLSSRSINSDNLLQHPWLQHGSSVIRGITSDIFEALKDYSKKSLFERILIFAVSQSLTMSQLENIRQVFLKFDDKNKGEISFADFRKAFQNYNEEEAEQVFSAINILRNKTISYHEFICPLMTASIVSERNIRSTFLQLCCSNQQYLMLTDLRELSNSECSMDPIFTMFNEAELSADSFLSYNRFKKYLGLHYCDRVILSPSKSVQMATRNEVNIPTTRPAISYNMVKDDAISQQWLQNLTKDMATETTYKDVRDIYTVINCDILGTGASGKVCKCRHKVTGLLYAMKTINISNMSKTKIDMLREEMRIMAKLDHPNIIRLHDTFETNTAIYLILDICTGGELLDNLNDQPSRCYSEMVACKIIYDILGAIRYCHEQGITHRDLKLENFLLESKTDQAFIKVIDFGLSSHFNRTQYLTECVGTPYYVAPEVLARRYNEKADIWSIGVIAYMPMTGTPLFDGDDEKEIMHAVANGQEVYCSRFKLISCAGQDFIKRCLIRDPVNRLSAQEAQSHIWFRTLQRNRPTIISSQIFSNLQQFLMRRPLSRLFMLALAHIQQYKYLVEVHQAFTVINSSKSGEINYEELKLALLGNFNENDIFRLFSMMDYERTGKISYHQFIAATFNLADLSEECWKMAFYKISYHNESFKMTDVESMLEKKATKKDMELYLLDWGKPSSFPISFMDFKNIVNGVDDTRVNPIVDITVMTKNPLTIDSIKSTISTVSQDISILMRPPTHSSSPKTPRRNFYREDSQQSFTALSPSLLPRIIATNEAKPSEQYNPLLTEKNNRLVVTKTTDVDDLTFTDNVNNSILNSSQEIKPPSGQSSIWRYKADEKKPNRNSTSKQSYNKKMDNVLTPTIDRTGVLTTFKFRSANDVIALPSINTSPKSLPKKGSLERKLKASK